MKRPRESERGVALLDHPARPRPGGGARQRDLPAGREGRADQRLRQGLGPVGAPRAGGDRGLAHRAARGRQGQQDTTPWTSSGPSRGPPSSWGTATVIDLRRGRGAEDQPQQARHAERDTRTNPAAPRVPGLPRAAGHRRLAGGRLRRLARQRRRPPRRRARKAATTCRSPARTRRRTTCSTRWRRSSSCGASPARSTTRSAPS